MPPVRQGILGEVSDGQTENPVWAGVEVDQPGRLCITMEGLEVQSPVSKEPKVSRAEVIAKGPLTAQINR
jgi:hypothetical protein